MSDAVLRTNEREAAQGDEAAARRVVADAIRRGEIPVGAVVTLDHARAPDNWARYGSNSEACPAKISGRWLVERRERGNGGHFWLRHMTAKGGLCRSTSGNTEGMTEERLRRVLVSVEPRGDAPPAREVERAPEGAPWVRRFSMCGPCILEGQLVRETAGFHVLDASRGGISKSTRVAKGGHHLEPCRSCQDHPQTSYPNGYMD